MSNLSDFLKSGVEAAGIVSVADATAINVDVDENVGIGTDSPDGTLHVHTNSAGNVTAESYADDLVVENSTDGGISLITPDANTSWISFLSPTDTLGAYISYKQSTALFTLGSHVTDGQIMIVSGPGTEAMRIDSSGRVLVGDNTTRSINSRNAAVQIQGTDADSGAMTIGRWSNNNEGTKIILAKSRGGIGTPTTVVTGDKVGELMFMGADGNDMTREVAAIQVLVEGTVAADQVPGVLAFKVANSAGSNQEVMRMDSSGKVGIGTDSPEAQLHINGPSANDAILNLWGDDGGTVNYKWRVRSKGNDDQLDFTNTGTSNIVLAMKSGGDVSIPTGNLVIGTAGKGIDFSAAANDHSGMSAEILDDYEEGIWTPIYHPSGVDFDSVTYDAITGGSYTKIGRVVHITGSIKTDSITVGSPTGNLNIYGLPFVPSPHGGATQENYCSIGISYAMGWAGEHPFGMYPVPNQPWLQPVYKTSVSGSTSTSQLADVGTGANANHLRFSGTYTTDE